MRELAAVLLVSILTLAVAGPAAAGELGAAQRTSGVGELFVLRAGAGELERLRAGVFELVLRRPSAVTVFTDRPRRVVREQRLRSFVKDFGELGFSADPPNAALSIAGAPTARDVHVFELARPRLTAGGRTLRFRARPLGGKPDGALRGFAGRADRVRVRRFGSAGLFVDSSGRQVAASFQLQAITPDRPAIVNLSNALIAPTPQFQIDFTGPADYGMAQDIFVITAGSVAAVDATVSLGLTVAAGATRLEGNADLPAGATGSVTIGNGSPLPLSGGPFSAPLP